MSCREMERQILLYLCDELDEGQRLLVEEHLKACESCAAVCERDRKLLQKVSAASMEEPSTTLLAQCRMKLDEALDRTSPPGFWARLAASFSPGFWAGSYRRWLAAHPALGAVVFLAAGFTVAIALPRLLERSSFDSTQAPKEPTITVAASPSGPRNLNVTGINWTPGATEAEAPTIEVHLTSQTPSVMQGTPDDVEIRQALMNVVQNSQRFSADTRLDSVELLRGYGKDDDVRKTLCRTARHDQNPGVRLKALEALRGLEQDELVRQTLLEALVSDTNPGVRVEAINALRAMVEGSPGVPGRADRQIVDVLRERMEKDTNTYIRIQSAAAVRELAQRGVY